MIKFFRKIRQKLLSENRITKYFVYTAGEIILVVIGILIALQINNLNADRKTEKTEIQLLQSFKQSLKSDISDIDFNIERHQRGLRACDSLLRLLESSVDINEDSLSRLFAHGFFVTRFIYSVSAFESMKTQGVNIISDPILQKKIVDVYDSRYRFFAASEDDFLDNYWLGIQSIYPGRFEEGLNYDLNSPGYPGDLRPLDFNALKSDVEFIYYLKTFRNWTNVYINFHYKGLRLRVSELLDLLDQELEKRENK